MKCADCRWAKPDYTMFGAEAYSCRVRPPVEGWPEVQADDFCGQFERRPFAAPGQIVLMED